MTRWCRLRLGLVSFVHSLFHCRLRPNDYAALAIWAMCYGVSLPRANIEYKEETRGP